MSDTEDAGGSRQLDPVRPWQVRRLAVPAVGEAAASPRQAAVPAEQAREDVAELRGRVEQFEAERARLAAELAASQARNRRIEHELARVTAEHLADRAAADRERTETDAVRAAAGTERDRLRAELARVRQALASAEARIGEITAGQAAERAIERAGAQRELDDACRRAEDAERTLAEAVELIETERSRALAAPANRRLGSLRLSSGPTGRSSAPRRPRAGPRWRRRGSRQPSGAPTRCGTRCWRNWRPSVPGCGPSSAAPAPRTAERSPATSRSRWRRCGRIRGVTSIAERAPLSARLEGVPRAYAPALVSAFNAVAFLLVRPDVNDLWAARARASAVDHGVGLTYWFSWFGGGSTPGNYSVLTPYLSALVTAELLGALSAVAIPVLCAVAMRGTEHPVAGTWVAAFATGVNLWSGRVPFLFGAAFAVGALITLRHRQIVLTAILALLSILASPVTGAFLAMGLSGVFLSNREYRRISLITIAVIGVGLGVVGIAFGAPGPEPFSNALKVEVVSGLLLMLLTRPPIWMRSTIWLAVIATFVIAAIPNGLGSNFSRIVWYCLPAAVVALSKFRVWLLTLIVLPLLVAGANGTVIDLRNAGKPISTVAYYKPLAAQLDTISGLANYRVEVVNHGAHAAYDALLDHAALARGWETQEDIALNSSLAQHDLDAVTYKVWLDNNAVGYVALPAIAVNDYPEYRLVQAATPDYLKLIWQTDDWRLYRVADATPIVPKPASLIDISQSKLTLAVPCTCTVNVRIRASKFLHAEERDTKAAARVSDDGSGWTTITTPAPGTYVLRGSLSGGLLR